MGLEEDLVFPTTRFGVGTEENEEIARALELALKRLADIIYDLCTESEEEKCEKARSECIEECMPKLGRTNTSFNDCIAKCMDRKGCSGYNPKWKT